MTDVQFTDNSAEALRELDAAAARALEIIGGIKESRAKGNVKIVSRDSGMSSDLEPEIRNSITHAVEGDTVYIGSTNQVAPYIELGTGPNYEPPPEWLKNEAQGGKGRAGLTHWIYFDALENKFRVGTPQKARPFLRPAMLDERDDLQALLKKELENA